ncbi:unnamed protein product [Rhizophagus irregularis]|nr:unnamed protein product [Rhizophagus irregularis]
MPYTCFLCSTNPLKTFSSKNSLYFHENSTHPNNKIIPHSRCLTSPSFYDICQFKNSFVMQLKARLQFHRSEPRAKILKMEPFSEGLFIILFYNEPTFQYSPAQRKYICKFEGTQGYEQLGNFFGNKNWGSKKRRTGTCAYVLMQNAQQTYNVTFIWKERVYKDSNTKLCCGSMRFEFNVDVKDFVEGSIGNLIYLNFDYIS